MYTTEDFDRAIQIPYNFDDVSRYLPQRSPNREQLSKLVEDLKRRVVYPGLQRDSHEVPGKIMEGALIIFDIISHVSQLNLRDMRSSDRRWRVGRVQLAIDRLRSLTYHDFIGINGYDFTINELRELYDDLITPE